MRELFSKKSKVRIGIALQGGGAYGAYAKGVLKALFNSEVFRSPSLEIRVVTGTSAGAVNGALITYGLNAGGMDKAIEVLDDFWEDIGNGGRLNSLISLFDPHASWPNMSQSLVTASSMLPNGYISRQLKGKLEKHVPDWSAVRKGPVKLFVNAVHEDSKTKERRHVVFTGDTLNADAVTASGALAEFGPHEIDGEKYFDGAYWRNPCTEDIEGEDITDLIVVTLQKLPAKGIVAEHQDEARKRMEKPGRDLLTGEIHNHVAFMSENASHLNMHVISLEVDDKWDRTSRLNNDPRWLADLEERGRKDALAWLEAHAEDIGVRSSYSNIKETKRAAAPVLSPV